jgi:hypothetical protein
MATKDEPQKSIGIKKERRFFDSGTKVELYKYE